MLVEFTPQDHGLAEVLAKERMDGGKKTVSKNKVARERRVVATVNEGRVTRTGDRKLHIRVVVGQFSPQAVNRLHDGIRIADIGTQIKLRCEVAANIGYHRDVIIGPGAWLGDSRVFASKHGDDFGIGKIAGGVGPM